MNAQNENGQLAKKVLDEYYQGFAERNPNLHVFSAHLHMDEATPHLHLDFIPCTTGSKRGLDTRVSLKQALASQGFRGGSRQETEWNQWVLSEKKQLAIVMERHGIAWEHKGTHEKHLSVYEYEKKMRAAEVETLGAEIADKKEEFEIISKRIENYRSGENALSEISKTLDTSPDYQLSEPKSLISAKSYKSKFVDPLIKKLKSLIKNVLLRYFNARDDYERLNQTNGKLYRENKTLRNVNEKLSSENRQLKEKTKEYLLLRKVFGNKHVDDLLEQAKMAKQSKQYGAKNKKYER